MTHAGVGTTTNQPLRGATNLPTTYHRPQVPSLMLGNNRPDVAHNNKAAPLTWMNSGVISIESWAICLVAKVALRDPKVPADRGGALVVPVFLFS